MRILAAIALVVVIASTSQAEVTVIASFANPQQTTAVAAYQTYGDVMDGMFVTANGSSSALWADTALQSGAAIGPNWSLAETGDTFEGIWTLTSQTDLTSLTIDAGAGDTMFDLAVSSGFGTPNSYNGWAFQLINPGSYSGDIQVTYSGPVSLVGDYPYGDLYRYMNIEFSSPFVGVLTFRADTDNASLGDDITPTVPVPGALVLAGIGSTLVRLLRRRQAA